jgi:hypothetical protein
LEQWLHAWPSFRPIGHELRHDAGERWVRFHSLPESRRYADTEGDYAMVLMRHLAILDELTSTVAAPVFAVAQSWSPEGGSALDPPVAELAEWRQWGSLPTETGDPSSGMIDLHLAELSTADPATMELLLLVADDEARVLFFDDSLRWLYAPYDGGADVLADPQVITRLRAEYTDWLSSHPGGL